MMPPKPPSRRVLQKKVALKSMTVCIAAACYSGKMCVTATDGQLTYGGVEADVLLDKRLWKGEWQFMYAGLPEHATMIFGELDEIVMGDPEAKTRKNIQKAVLAAFKTFLSNTSSFSVLSPFDLTMKEFKDEGLKMMGPERFRKMSEDIESSAQGIQDQLLVVGWGHAPASVMIYEVGSYGARSYGHAGLAAIGSGADVALSNLLLLGQSRHCTLAKTIYNVAAAKFSSEHSTGRFVGHNTSIHISWKKGDEDGEGIPGVFVPESDVATLRSIWEEHGRPRAPDEASSTTLDIVQRIIGGFTAQEAADHMAANTRMIEKAAKIARP